MAEVVAVRRGREGSRWINERPSSEDVAKWFKDVPLHEGMDHEKYVNGLTLIPAKDKGNEIVGYSDEGVPIVAERENLTFTPYMKVETRVAYFWDLIAAHRDQGWVGRVEPVDEPTQRAIRVLTRAIADAEALERMDIADMLRALLERGKALGLPPGFFAYSATKPDGKVANFVGYSCRVQVTGFIGDLDERQVIAEGQGTKIVSTATRWDADVNALMKAETGAIGRALGMAGILVMPGSGVATAEDMVEALAHTGTGGVDASAAAQLPADQAAASNERQADGDVELRRQAGEIIRTLEADFPQDLEQFRVWARGRKFGSLNELSSPALKGVVKKLEKTLDDARRKQAGGEAPSEDDVPLT